MKTNVLSLPFPNFQYKTALAFGGSDNLKGNHAKKARTLDSKRSVHLVMRSSLARGAMSFLLHSKPIEHIIEKQAKNFGIQIYEMANVGNHLHLLLRFTYRPQFFRFLKSVTGLIARRVLKAERGASKVGLLRRQKSKRFWDSRPYTRVVAWAKDFPNVKKYIVLNRLEALLGMDRLSARAMMAAAEKFLSSPNLVTIGFG